MSAPEPFDYSNLSGRPPGRFVTVAGRVLPGVARVQAEVPSFAQAWREANLAALRPDDTIRNRPLWAALGDSLTLGIGAPTPDRGWVGQAQARLAAAGHPYRVVNLAVSGTKTAELIERQLPVLDTLRADLVTVMIGSNDLSRPSNRRRLVERFETVLRRVPAGTVVATLPNPARVAREVNTIIDRIAAERHLVVADMRDSRTASWRGRLAADHFHPNEFGYAAIAEVIGDVLLRVVAAP